MVSIYGCVPSCANGHYQKQVQNQCLFVFLKTTAVKLQYLQKQPIRSCMDKGRKLANSPEHLESCFPLLNINELKRQVLPVLICRVWKPAASRVNH